MPGRGDLRRRGADRGGSVTQGPVIQGPLGAASGESPSPVRAKRAFRKVAARSTVSYELTCFDGLSENAG